MLRLSFLSILVAGAVSVPSLGRAPARGTEFQANTRVYELRIYTANAGKLPDLHRMFRSLGTRLFARHGMQNVFAGTVLEGAASDGADAPNMVVWIVGHSDRSAAGRAWAAVEGDAEWKAAAARVGQDGPLLAKAPTSIFMSATDYSPTIDTPSAGTTDSGTHLFELRKYNTGASGLPYTAHRFRVGMANILAKTGMTPIAYWTATDESAFIYLVAHSDRDTARASWSNFMTPYRAFMADYPKRPDAIAAVPRTAEENRFLVPTDYSARR
jgi:hypothetical protein